MGKQVGCSADCPKRRVGCRSACPNWQAHERRKQLRYANKAREYAAYPVSAEKEKRYRKKLKEGR